MEQQEFVSQEIFYDQNESPFGSETASTVQRFANYIIDLMIFCVIMFGMEIMMGVLFAAAGRTFESLGDNTFTGNKLSDYLMIYTLYVLFYTFSEGASSGRTIGKLITRTKAVREDESEITWTDSLIRSLCRIVPFEIFSAFGSYPWHDKWSHTKVIRINSK